MRRAILLLATVLHLNAQDAEMVLRTLVGYTAMSNTRPLTPEQKAEVATLGQQAQSAARQGQFGEAMRHYLHGTAVMQGREWTPEAEFAAALQARPRKDPLGLDLAIDNLFWSYAVWKKNHAGIGLGAAVIAWLIAALSLVVTALRTQG